VGEVHQLFSARRWVAAWEELRGHILTGEGPWGADGTCILGMAEIMPQSDRRPRPERNRIEVLRCQVSRPDARFQVLDFLARRATTSGGGG
jgi:hypothetical protein